MKKFLCIVLAMACILSLVACGNSSTAEKTADKAVSSAIDKLPNKDNKVDKETMPTEPTINKESELDETLPSKKDEKPDKEIEDKEKNKKEKTEKENKGDKEPVDTEPQEDDSVQFNAKVLEVLDSSILVEPVFGSSELNSSDAIYVTTTGIKLPKNLQVDDYVRITYNGVILESYPAQINTVFEIVKHGSSFIVPSDPEILNPIVTFENHVVYANWTDSPMINAGSISNSSQYPVYKFESEQDVVDFRTKFEKILSFNAFDDVCVAWNNEFFEENSVVLAYVTSGSGSTKYSVYNVEFTANGLNIELSVNSPEVGTCDMAGWFVMVVVPKATLENCTEYNVYTNSLFKKIGETISKKATF